jgi:hypothetical protein
MRATFMSVFCLCLMVAASRGQSLPAQGTFSASEGTCPQCKPGEWAVTVNVQVPHGQYVYVENPPCSENINHELEKMGSQLSDVALPGISQVAGPAIDLVSDQARAVVSDNIRGFVGELLSKYTEPSAQCHLVSAIIPSDATIMGKTLIVDDGDRGIGDCDHNEGGQYTCWFDDSHDVGWCKWLEPERKGNTVSAVFMNWSHNRDRLASMTIFFKPAPGKEPIPTRKFIKGGATNQPTILATSTSADTCINGVWREQYDNPRSWKFDVTGNTLTIRRTDNFVTGTFSKSGGGWSGQLKWGNGDTWNNVVLTPTAACDQVRTNQSWWYRR